MHTICQENLINYMKYATLFSTFISQIWLLSNNGLNINLKKCGFAKIDINFLGFVVGNQHIQVDNNRKLTICNLERPNDISTISFFLGCAGYFRSFIKRNVGITAPL